jgi:hypothetical protein
MQFDLPTSSSIDKIVEIAISWQLEQLADIWFEYENNLFKTGPFIRLILRYSKHEIEWLAFQTGAKASFLLDK